MKPLRNLNKRVAHLEQTRQKKIRDTEIISVDSAYDNVYILTLNDPAQGNTDTSRVGDKIINVGLQANVEFRQDASPATVCRILIIHDFNNTITQASDIFSGYSSNYATPYQLMTWDFQRNFKVLYDRLIPIRSWDESGVGRVSMSAIKQIYLKFNIPTRFDDASTTINAGAIKLVLTSNAPNSGSKPGCTGYFRVMFYDS